MSEELLWRRVIVINTDRLMLEDTAKSLMSSYRHARDADERREDAQVWTPKNVDKEISCAWTYFFSPRAAEIAKTLLQNPALEVEACQEPDLSTLREVKV